jgi:arginase
MKKKTSASYYGIESRLGIINFLNGTTAANDGVELAPEAILTEEFTHDKTQVRYTFKKPDELKSYASDGKVSPDLYFTALMTHSATLVGLIKDTITDDDIQVVVGGDHSVGYPSLASTIANYGVDDVGVIMFDSHSDFCKISESPSGNFHGMWLRPFFDTFDQEFVEGITKMLIGEKKLPGSNILYVGDLEGEPYYDPIVEGGIIVRHGIKTISKKELTGEDSYHALAKLAEFVKDKKYIHVSFDIDVMQAAVAPATGISGDWGLSAEQVQPVLEIIANSGKIVAIDMTEVNPTKLGGAKTVDYAQHVLTTLLRPYIK